MKSISLRWDIFLMLTWDEKYLPQLFPYFLGIPLLSYFLHLSCLHRIELQTTLITNYLKFKKLKKSDLLLKNI